MPASRRFFLLPAYSGAELAGVPSLPAIKIEQFALPWDAIVPFVNPAGFVSFGLVALALALIVTMRQVSEHHQALSAVAVITLIFAFGPALGLYNLIPFSNLLLPERFAAVSVVFLALILATTTWQLRRSAFVVAAIVLIFVVDSFPAWQQMVQSSPATSRQDVAALLQNSPRSGRVAPLDGADTTAGELFAITHEAGLETTSGWRLENTSQQNMTRRLYRAYEQQPAYVERGTLAMGCRHRADATGCACSERVRGGCDDGSARTATAPDSIRHGAGAA